MKNKVKTFTWKRIERICKKFCKKLKNRRFDCIVGITRGGLIPSVIISHQLGIREVIPIQIFETVNDKINADKESPVLGPNIDFSCLKNKSVLIVDDIYGSGSTLNFITQAIAKYVKQMYSFVCVYNKKNDKNIYEKPNYIGVEINCWAIFPWEVKKVE